MSWILEAERLRGLSQYLTSQTHIDVRPLSSQLHPAFAGKIINDASHAGFPYLDQSLEQLSIELPGAGVFHR